MNRGFRVKSLRWKDTYGSLTQDYDGQGFVYVNWDRTSFEDEIPISEVEPVDRPAIEPRCNGVQDCTVPTHDHVVDPTVSYEEQNFNPHTGELLCNDCGQVMFYDTGRDQYYHTDPNSSVCFLIPHGHDWP